MIYLVIAKSKLLLTVIWHRTDLLLVDAFTHTVAYKIKEVKVNIPFSFLNILCCLVLFFVGFQEVTVGKNFFLFCSTYNNGTCKYK